jgi:hypothetical protein
VLSSKIAFAFILHQQRAPLPALFPNHFPALIWGTCFLACPLWSFIGLRYCVFGPVYSTRPSNYHRIYAYALLSPQRLRKYVHPMSTPRYFMDTARRPPPPPLRLQHPAKHTSNIAGAAASSEYQTLLYDLPSTAPLSPPTPKRELISPASPGFSGRSANRRPASGRASPHPRSATPSLVQVDLEAFAERCRKW